jgi:pyruvate/2-oxoglutarate dehydrogenase complex dihydrolipoamide acyltransferase (E2) component
VNRRLLLVVAGWVLTALVATGAGIAVIGLVGRTFAGGPGDVLSAEEARDALARAEASPRPTRPSPGPSSSPAVPEPTPTASAEASPRPTPEATPAPTPTAVSRVITTRGGSVVARCQGGLVTLRSWSPAQGYEVDDVDPGPDESAKVTFESDRGEVEIEVRCSASGPVHTVETDTETD